MDRINVMQLGSPTGLYGAERWILALIKHLSAGKVRSFVAAIKDDPDLEVPLCQEADKLGFRTHVFQVNGRFNLSAVRQLRRFILKNDIHILHTHYYKTDLIGLLASKGTNCQTISTPHGWSTNVDLKLRFYEQLDRILFPFMDAVVPLSPDLYASLANSSWYRVLHSLRRRMSTNPQITNNEKTNLRLIQNGVDISEIDSVQSVASGLQPSGVHDDFTFGYIGQVIPRKGLDVLLHALAKLGSGVAWQAAIVGDGEQRLELEALAAELGVQDRVRFFGFRENRLEFLRGFDCFVLPSRLEGIPRCLMEAMAAEVPVIGSDIPGCTDLIEHGSSGLLFANGDSTALAHVLHKVALEPEIRSRLAAKGRELIREQYSAEGMAKRYEQLYCAMT